MSAYIVTFKEERDLILLEEYELSNIKLPKHIKKIVMCDMDEKQANKLKSNTEISSVELDSAEQLLTNEDSETGDTSYAYDLMNVKEFHNLGFKGKGVKVAVLDSGVQKHSDLIVKGGYNAYDESIPYDKNLANAHGTKVAGIIGMQGKNNGLMGIAPECDLYAVRIDDGGGAINRTLWSSQIKAMDWAIDNNMDAINCSFSSPQESDSRREAFKSAYENGIAIFCSAGNRQGSTDTGLSTITYPSKYPFVITSANIDSKKKRYRTSSVGRGLNFSSGGVSVNTTTIDGGNETSEKYANGTGTSYASPAVAGVYALYKQKFPYDSREKILQRMYVNSERLGNPWEYGAGIPKFPDIDYQNIIIKRR